MSPLRVSVLMSNHEPLWQYAIRIGLDWVFRKRSRALSFFRGGLSLALVSLGVMEFKVAISRSSDQGSLLFEYGDTSGPPDVIFFISCLLGMGIMVVSGVCEICSQQAERARLARKRVIVIEQRGLRDTSDTPLEDVVPDSIEGVTVPLLIDLRQRVRDGQIVNPEMALERLMTLPTELSLKRGRYDPADLAIVYGGLVSVPFAFLTGLLVDDESRVYVFDWDRHHERWRSLDGSDDGDRYVVEGFDELPALLSEVIVAVSTSRRVDLLAARSMLGNLPSIHLDLPKKSSDCHWSETKQAALARIFHDTVVEVSNRGATRLHIFIASQNSVAFNLGRRYDKRNLPPVIVYQFERSESPPFPWGIVMPVHGIDGPEIFRP